MKLRDYQEKAIASVHQAFNEGVQGVFLMLPTGGGKTVIFTEMIRQWVANGERCVVVAHRQELIKQAGSTIERCGMYHGVIKACNSTFPLAPIQVVSIDSMRNRELPWQPDRIIIDEAHLSKADRYDKFLKKYPDAKLLLVSATPIRSDGSGFDDIAQVLITGSATEELIKHPEGPFLVHPRIYTASDIGDIDRKVKTTAGDFNKGQLEEYMSQVELVGDVLEFYQEKAPGRKGVIFCAGVAHSKTIASEFVQAGIPAEHLDGTTPEIERAAILNRLRSGETMIVTNAAVLTEGWDEPSISYVGLARPTKSLALYIQMAGRGLRIHPGKEDCIIADHGANVPRHGHILQPRKWTLEGTKGEPKKKKKVNLYKECIRCTFWHLKTAPACPHCGLEKPAKVVQVIINQNLIEAGVDEALEENPIITAFVQKLRFAKRQGYKSGYAYHKVVEKFGELEVKSVLTWKLSQLLQSEHYYNYQPGAEVEIESKAESEEVVSYAQN